MLDRFARAGAVLDFGSGPGGLREQLPDTFVVTVDLRTFDGLDLQADGCRLPFLDKAFTTTVCMDVLEHVPAALRPALVAELVRVTSDLLVVAGPMGAASESADRRLEGWLQRTTRPVPEWLEEHLATGLYPTVEELDRLVGRPPLWSGRGISISAHRLTQAAAGLRGGTAVGRAVTSSPIGRTTLAWVTSVGAPYRRVLAYDLAPVEFSVVMATRNRADRLPSAVESVLAQTVRNLEVIIVNDASTDDTAEVARRIEQRDHRVRVIDVKSPTGSAGLARNIGMRSARGAALAFCDDDVCWRPEHLATCAKALARSEACYTTAARFLPDGQYYDLAGRAWGESGPQSGDIDANTIAVRRSAMRPFPDGRGRYACEDVLLAARLFRRGVRFEFLTDVTVDYTFNPASHTYRYSITEQDGRTVVTSRPKVDGWRSAKGRVLEAVGVRVKRVRRRRTKAAA